jgi:hypothetical protein
MSDQSPYSEHGRYIEVADHNRLVKEIATTMDATIAEQAERIATLEAALGEEQADTYGIGYKEAYHGLRDLSAAKDARIAALESALRKIMNIEIITSADDDYAERAEVFYGCLTHTIRVAEMALDLCHASPEQADGSVSPDKPALQTGDGETR